MKNSFYSDTELVGLLGFPIKQSYSPFIHNVAAELTGTKIIYLPFEVHSSNLKDAIKGMVALGIRGLNVTYPHKVSVVEYLNKLSEEAAVIGAVNTIVNDLGKLTGYNTDVHGINVSLTPFKSTINGNEISIFGSGGGARAVIYTLIRYYKPKKIYLINRTAEHAESLKQHFKNKMRFDVMVKIFSWKIFMANPRAGAFRSRIRRQSRRAHSRFSSSGVSGLPDGKVQALPWARTKETVLYLSPRSGSSW